MASAISLALDLNLWHKLPYCVRHCAPPPLSFCSQKQSQNRPHLTHFQQFNCRKFFFYYTCPFVYDQTGPFSSPFLSPIRARERARACVSVSSDVYVCTCAIWMLSYNVQLQGSWGAGGGGMYKSKISIIVHGMISPLCQLS